jgi:hypothetical protein
VSARGTHLYFAVVLGATFGAGCADSKEGLPTNTLNSADVSSVVFLVQNADPGAVMDALFSGKISADAAGCLRLSGDDPSTVVWPVGFSVKSEAADLLILDKSGRLVGRVGGSFRLGGGHVPQLHDGIRMSAAARDLAHARCPGQFWIVGDVPS